MNEVFNKVLEEKENRYKRRLIFENLHKNQTCICLSLNIPFIYKQNNFDECLDLLNYAIKEVNNHINIKSYEVYKNELYVLFSSQNDANLVKKQCIEIENKFNFFRLIDLDVYYLHQVIKTREAGRTCFLCEDLAISCIRNSTHTKEDITKKIDEYFDDFYVYYSKQINFKEDFSNIALRAILYEVSLAPKIGLVDRFSSNSHDDMDIFIFINSSTSFGEYLKYFYNLGMISKKNDFKRLKILGQEAEKYMFNSTNNINTHKGAIFLFSIVMFSLAKLKVTNTKINLINLSIKIKELCVKLCVKELENITHYSTNGEISYHKFKIKGIRKEAEEGLKNTMKSYLYFNSLDCSFYLKTMRTLFFIISEIDDTCLLKRLNFNFNKYIKVKKTCAKLANINDEIKMIRIIKKLNFIYTAQKISFGGAADTLSLVLFFYFSNLKYD